MFYITKLHTDQDSIKSYAYIIHCGYLHHIIFLPLISITAVAQLAPPVPVSGLVIIELQPPLWTQHSVHLTNVVNAVAVVTTVSGSGVYSGHRRIWSGFQFFSRNRYVNIIMNIMNNIHDDITVTFSTVFRQWLSAMCSQQLLTGPLHEQLLLVLAAHWPIAKLPQKLTTFRRLGD